MLPGTNNRKSRYNDPERAVLPLYLSFGENVLGSQNRPFSVPKLEKLEVSVLKTNMISKPLEVTLNSMHIPNERLSKFVRLFERKTGKKLSEQEMLIRAEKLLRTISILYQPITFSDYCSALTKKLVIKKRKSLGIIKNSNIKTL